MNQREIESATASMSFKWKHFYYNLYLDGYRKGMLTGNDFMQCLVMIGFTPEEALLEYVERADENKPTERKSYGSRNRH